MQKTVWLIVGYWALWQLARVFEIAPHVSAFYPAVALGTAFIAVYGLKYLPALFVAAALSSFPEMLYSGFGTFDWFQVARQTLIYGFAGHFLTRNFSAGPTIGNSSDAITFIVVAILTTAVSAICATYLFNNFKAIPVDALKGIFFSFWVGDLAGLVMVFPLVAMLLNRRQARPLSQILASTVSLEATFIGKVVFAPTIVSIIGFGATVLGNGTSNYGYVIVLPVVWLASTQGMYGGIIAAMVANVSAVFVYNFFEIQSYPTVELQVLFAMTSAIGLVVGSLFDERRRLEEYKLEREREFCQLSRAATLGELGATIAHEINTPLQVATINAHLAVEQLAAKDPESFDKITSYNEQVKLAIDKAAKIQRNISSFMRNSDDEAVPTDITQAIKDAFEMLSHGLESKGISVKFDLPKKPAVILASSIELQQVVINLVKNAQAAILENMPVQKQITIRLKREDNDWVLYVEDTGTGLSEEALEKVFSSFYTTKSDGLGIGLSICRNVAEGYRGTLTAENWEYGARFIVRLPALDIEHV